MNKIFLLLQLIGWWFYPAFAATKTPATNHTILMITVTASFINTGNIASKIRYIPGGAKCKQSQNNHRKCDGATVHKQNRLSPLLKQVIVIK